MLETGRLRCARSSYLGAYSHPHPAQHPFAHASACTRTTALRHGMCVTVPGKLAVVPALSYFICCICAAFVGVRFRGCRLLFRGTRRCEAPMGTVSTLLTMRACPSHKPAHLRPPCSPHAYALAARLAHHALVRSCRAHAVACVARRCAMCVQTHVLGGELRVRNAAGEGWDGQGS